MGYSPWGHKGLDMSEPTDAHIFINCAYSYMQVILNKQVLWQKGGGSRKTEYPHLLNLVPVGIHVISLANLNLFNCVRERTGN